MSTTSVSRNNYRAVTIASAYFHFSPTQKNKNCNRPLFWVLSPS